MLITQEPRRRTVRGLWIYFAALGATWATVVAGHMFEGSHQRPLPKDFAQAQAWEGKHVVVETAVAADMRPYRVEVSKNRFGDLCLFVEITSVPGGGGGGCGTPGNLGSMSYGSDGVIQGATTEPVRTVDITTSAGVLTVVTKPLGEPFPGFRYFVGIFPRGTHFTKVVDRDASGRVLKSSDLA